MTEQRYDTDIVIAEDEAMREHMGNIRDYYAEYCWNSLLTHIPWKQLEGAYLYKAG